MLSMGGKVRVRLEAYPARLRLFRDTCFAPWLDLVDQRDPMLVHIFLLSQYLPPVPVTDSVEFHVGPHVLHFTREHFCLITGFRFGTERVRRRPKVDTFHSIHFPGRYSTILVSDLIDLLDDDTRFSAMSDDDAVRLCLLLIYECCFIGRESKLSVDTEFIDLVDDFEAWNDFPWGSHLWDITARAIRHSTDGEKERHASKQKGLELRYTLVGFTYPFKVMFIINNFI